MVSGIALMFLAAFAQQAPCGLTVMTRPICPYPQVAKYTGSGSTDDAVNFVCGTR